jgi:hypothetical protein
MQRGSYNGCNAVRCFALTDSEKLTLPGLVGTMMGMACILFT